MMHSISTKLEPVLPNGGINIPTAALRIINTAANILIIRKDSLVNEPCQTRNGEDRPCHSKHTSKEREHNHVMRIVIRVPQCKDTSNCREDDVASTVKKYHTFFHI